MTDEFRKGLILGMSLNKPIIIGGMVMNYSTEEQRIGTWIDGKAIYQKTFIINTLQLIQGDTIDYCIITTDPKMIPLYSFGYCVLYNGNDRYWEALIPTPDAGFGYFSPIAKNDDNDIYISTNSLRIGWNIAEIYITIQYTKTTD